MVGVNKDDVFLGTVISIAAIDVLWVVYYFVTDLERSSWRSHLDKNLPAGVS